MLAGDALLRFEAAQDALDIALKTLDADTIIGAASDLHHASAALSAPGAWPHAADIEQRLASALKRIESCRLRLLFLSDHTARHVEALTGSVSGPTPNRRDRHG